MTSHPAPTQELGQKAKPDLLVRFGLPSVLAFVAALFATAAFLPYKNTASTSLTVVRLYTTAAASGHIHLLVREGEAVYAGQPVAEVRQDRGELTASTVLPPKMAGMFRPELQATLVLQSGQRVLATIESFSAGVHDTTNLRLTIKQPLAIPPGTQATLIVSSPQQTILRQLLRPTTP